MSEGQERVTKKSSLLSSLNPSIIREGETFVSLFTPRSSLKSKIAFSLADGAEHVAISKNQCKVAFTLAEILITLGIIAIVAAMTMPSLIANYQKKRTVAQLKKAYSTFAQALVQSQYENQNSSEWEVTDLGSSYDENLKYFETYWKPYLKVIKVCKTMSECGYDITAYASVSDRNNYRYYGPGNNVPGFIYGDGTYAYIRPYSYHPDTPGFDKLQLLSIDLNGPQRPNMIGRDVFQFEIDISRGVISGYTYVSPDMCTKDKIANSTKYARGCAGKIMHDGWEILDDYPW